MRRETSCRPLVPYGQHGTGVTRFHSGPAGLGPPGLSFRHEAVGVPLDRTTKIVPVIVPAPPRRLPFLPIPTNIQKGRPIARSAALGLSIPLSVRGCFDTLKSCLQGFESQAAHQSVQNIEPSRRPSAFSRLPNRFPTPPYNSPRCRGRGSIFLKRVHLYL